jgi:hypothetical protein
MLAIGYQGPLLLEDAVDLAVMMVATGRAIPPTRWVDELREAAEGEAMRSMFGI